MPKLVAKRVWSPRHRVLLLSSLIALSFWLRLINLDAFSMWTDEGLTTLRSGYSIDEILSNRIEIQDAVTKDTHPPFYYLIIHLSQKLLGQTDFAYRYPSLLAGVLLVPLLFHFGRRLQGSGTGLVAAALAAINPLQIWYANEARMYTPLVLLAALTSYALWRAISGRHFRRYLFFYMVLASLSFYTHYTTVFLIVGQSLFWIYLLWRQGQRRLLIGAAAIGLLIAIPLVPYTIPRLFTGAEASYNIVPPHVMLKDVIFAFSQGVTLKVSPFSISSAVIALGLLLAGAVASRTDRQKLAFLLIYLFAAVFGLMAGSIIKPMYQGVRHIMIGSPAFLLLAAMGLVWIGSKAAAARRGGTVVFWWAVTLGGTAVMLMSSFASLRNMYHGALYERSDFRSLIRYVEERAGSNDVLVYNDAILLATQAHYGTRSDVEATALPIYPHQGETSLPHLETLAGEYKRVWFVTNPPAGGRDRERVVRNWLDNNLFVVDEHDFPGRITEVKVIAYATAPEMVDTIPEGTIPLSIAWDGVPALEGIQLDFEQPAAYPTLWIDLFWRGGIEPAEDTVVHFSLRGASGHEWLSRSQILSQRTADRWQESHLVRQSYYLAIPAGMPPGEFTLFAHPFSGEQDSALGEAEPLADIILATSDAWPISPALPDSDMPSIRFDNDLTLLAVTMADDHVRPGHVLPISLFWRAEKGLSLSDINYEIEIVGPDGMSLDSQKGLPGADWLTDWPAGILIRQDTGLRFPPDSEAGSYRLGWRLIDADEPIGGRPLWRPWSSESIMQGRVQVTSWPLITELPNAGTILEAQFDSIIQLYGYDLDYSEAGSVDLTLYWQAKTVPNENYHAFVHLVSSDGEIVSQLDRVPVDWLRPTLGWRLNEVLTDNYLLGIPSEVKAGSYDLIVGLYNPEDSVRLPVSLHGVPQSGDQLSLSTISVP